MKVHYEWYSSVRPSGAIYRSAKCGSITEESPHGFGTPIVMRSVWDWIPHRARCLRCDAALVTERHVTPEIELTIETALHQLAAQMQTWPDAWHVDPHGTGGNPHRWFDASGGSSWSRSLRVCPCGATDSRPFLTVPRRHGKEAAAMAIKAARETARKP